MEPSDRAETATKKQGPPQPGKYILRQRQAASVTGVPADPRDPTESDVRESDVVLKFGPQRVVQIGRAKGFCQIPVELVDDGQISMKHAVIRKNRNGTLSVEPLVTD